MYAVHSFPCSKSTWIISVNQTLDPDNSIIFSGQVHDVFADQSIDFTNVVNLILGTGVNELNARGDHTEYLQKTLDNCRSVFPNLKNVYIFYTTVYFREHDLVSDCNITCLHLPYFLLRSTLTDLSQFNEWEVGDKKAICLVGDIRNRNHKFPVLYYFMLQNNLESLNYSLLEDNYGPDHFSEHHVSSVVRQLNETFNSNLDLKSFENLYKTLSRRFPNDEEHVFPKHNGLSKYTHNFPEQWNTSTCNLVLECIFYGLQKHLQRDHMNGQQSFFFSEKIWKPILAGKPFITISENDLIYSQLEDMGFRTFLKYTSNPEKIENKTMEEYLKVCHDRTMSFLNNVESNKVSILEDVTHNVAKWKELGEQAWDNLHRICPPSKDITREHFCEFFNHFPNFTDDQIQNWNNND